jgi:predicted deacylase
VVSGPSETEWNRELTQQQLVSVGIGMMAGATVLGGLLYLVRRQVERGDVLAVTVVHELSPEAEQTVRDLQLDLVETRDRMLSDVVPLLEQGIQHQVRLFPSKTTG